MSCVHVLEDTGLTGRLEVPGRESRGAQPALLPNALQAATNGASNQLIDPVRGSRPRRTLCIPHISRVCPVFVIKSRLSDRAHTADYPTRGRIKS